MWTVYAQPDGSVSSILQSTGFSPYVLVHIVTATGRNNSKIQVPPLLRQRHNAALGLLYKSSFGPQSSLSLNMLLGCDSWFIQNILWTWSKTRHPTLNGTQDLKQVLISQLWQCICITFVNNYLCQGCSNFSLLSAALRLFLWITAASQCKLFLWIMFRNRIYLIISQFTRAYKYYEMSNILMHLFKHKSTRPFCRLCYKYPHTADKKFLSMHGRHNLCFELHVHGCILLYRRRMRP